MPYNSETKRSQVDHFPAYARYNHWQKCWVSHQSFLAEKTQDRDIKRHISAVIPGRGRFEPSWTMTVAPCRAKVFYTNYHDLLETEDTHVPSIQDNK